MPAPNHPEAYSVMQERRCANYKPNIWSYDFVQSLTSEFTSPTKGYMYPKPTQDDIYTARAKDLKEDSMHLLSQVPDLCKLHVVERITKLGLSHLFYKEIKDALDSIASNLNDVTVFKDDILATALSFRLLRQHGYTVSQDMFVDFVDEMGDPLKGRVAGFDIRGLLELYEASHLATDGEDIMVEAKAFSYKNLVDSHGIMEDVNLAKQVAHALELPCHWRVIWFNVRHQIHAYELQNDSNPVLLELAKLNFNIVQAKHLEDLKEVSRWWRNLGLIENIDFTRDRLVESFLWTVGVSCEPQHSLFRKCLTKVVTFILVIDDLYDIYGSFQELQCFTRAVDRWNSEEVQQLPECIKICFQLLKQTIHEIAHDIQKQKGWDDILAYMRLAWADFCKGLLQEAWWHNKSYVPLLKEYLRCAWITSSGPLISLISFLCTANGTSEELKDKWEECHDLVYYTSLIIRLCNDLGTSAAEIERGDAPSSIICYMAEAGVKEEIARKHIEEMICSVWSKINMELIRRSAEQKMNVDLIINAARVCHFIYYKGDGFSVQDGDTRNKIKRLLIEPIQL